MNRIFAAVLLVVAASAAEAAPNNWIGAAVGDWNDSTSWSAGAVPSGADDVMIGAAFVVAYATNPAPSLNSLSLGGGAVFLTYSGVTAAGGVSLQSGSGLQFGATAPISLGSLTLQSGSSATYVAPPVASASAPLLALQIGQFTLSAGATVTVSGRGYSGGGISANGYGPGAGGLGGGVAGGGGGGHGGAGGAGGGASNVGAANDSQPPTDAGSGGGGCPSAGGGAGGGFLAIYAGTATIDGSIEADGGDGVGSGGFGGGGGAGGGVILQAQVLQGAGRISADGGAGGTGISRGGGGAGGGFIWIREISGWSVLRSTLTLSVGAGAAGGGAVAGAAGSTGVLYADPRHWSGGGSSSLASDAQNWNLGLLPVDGQRIVLGSSATAVVCLWDLSVSVGSAAVVSSYRSSLYLNASMSVTGDYQMSGGTLTANPGLTMSVGGDLTQTAGRIDLSGSTLTLAGAGLSMAASFYDARVGTLTVSGVSPATATVAGPLTVVNQINLPAGATLSLTTGTVRFEGDGPFIGAGSVNATAAATFAAAGSSTQTWTPWPGSLGRLKISNPNASGLRLATGGGQTYTLSGGVLVDTGAILTLAGSRLVVAGDWASYGAIAPTGSTVVFRAVSGTQTVSAGGSFDNVSVDNAGAVLQLSTTVVFAGQAAIQTGALNLANSNLYVRGNWTESPGAIVSGGANISVFDGSRPQVVTQLSGNSFGTFRAANTAQINISSTLATTGGFHWDAGNLVYSGAKLIIGGDMQVHGGIILTVAGSTVIFNGSASTQTVNFPSFGDVAVAHYGPYGVLFTGNAALASFRILPGAVFNGGSSLITVSGSSYDTALSTYYATNPAHQVLWQPAGGTLAVGAGSVVNAKLTLDTNMTATLAGDLNLMGAGNIFDIRAGAKLIEPVGGSTIAFRGSADFRPSAGANWTYAGDVANSWLVFEGSGTRGAFMSTTTVGSLRVSLNTSSDSFRAPTLNMLKHLVLEGGTFSPSGSATIGVGGDFIQSSGVIDFGTASTGTIVLAGASTQTVRLASGAHALWHMTDLNASTVTLASDMLVRGDCVISTGSFRLGSGNVRVQGLLQVSTAAGFSSQGSTVTLDGASGGRPAQSLAVYGSGAFDGLAVNVAAATLLTPTTAVIFTDEFAGTLTIASGRQLTAADLRLGTSGGGPVRLQSSAPGSPWHLKVLVVSSVTATTVSDSNASSGILIDANDGRSSDAGGNSNWNFASRILVLLPGETFTPRVPPGKTGTPVISTAGVPMTITVMAVSSSYDLSASTGVVTLTSDDAFAAIGGTQTLSAGRATFSATPFIAEPNPRSTHFSASTSFGSGLSTGSVIPAGLSRLQIVMPGEAASPGSPTGRSGYAWPRVRGIPFSATVRSVDLYYNLIATVTHSFALGTNASSSTLPFPPDLVAGTADVNGFIFYSTGLFTFNATDLTQVNVFSATSSVFGVVPPSVSSPTAAFYIPTGAAVATLGGWIAGTAADGSSISRVRVDLTEIETGFHFDGASSFASAVAVYSTSTLASPLAASTSWSNPVPDAALASGRHYAAVAIVEDPTGFFGVAASTFVIDRSALFYGARSGQGSAAAVASSTSGCQVLTTSLTFTVAGSGIDPGGAVAVRVPPGWSRPAGVSSQIPPPFGYWTIVSTSQVAVAGSSTVVVAPAAFGAQTLGSDWILLSVATNSAAGFLPGQRITFVYTGMPPLSTEGRGAQTFGVWSAGDASSPLAPISTQPFISLNAGTARLVAFKDQDSLVLGPGQKSANMQLKVIDQCGNDNLGVSSGTATLSVVVPDGTGYATDAGAVFMSSHDVVISTVVLPLNVSYSQAFSVTTSTNAPQAYVKASVVFPLISTKTAVVAMRPIGLPGSAESFSGVSIDTGTLVSGATSAALSALVPDASPIRISFTLSDPNLSWDAVLSTDAVNFTSAVFRASGFGDPARPIGLIWDGVDRVSSQPARMASAGHYRLRLRAGGGSVVDTSREAVVPQTAGYAGRLGAGAAGAQVRAMGPGAGEGAFALASATGYFLLQGLRFGQTYQLTVTTASRVGTVGVDLSTIVAAGPASFPVADLGSIVLPTVAPVRLSAMLPVPSPFDAVGGYVGRGADGAVAFTGPLRFSTGSATSDDAGPLFGRAASTWSVVYAPAGVYSVEVDVPDLRVSTTIANLTLGPAGLDFFIPLSKVAGISGWVVLPSTISAPLTASIAAVRDGFAAPAAFASVLISSAPPVVGSSSGAYTLYGLDPGTWTILASAPGFISTATRIVVFSDADVAAPAVTLGSGGSIAGILSVVGDSGGVAQCAAGAGGTYDACPAGRFDVSVEATAMATLDRGATVVRLSTSATSAQSAFSITGLTPGLWTLRATVPGFTLVPSSGVVVAVSGAAASTAAVVMNRADARANIVVQIPPVIPAGCRSTTTWSSLGLTLETSDGNSRIYGDATSFGGGGAFARYYCSSATFFTPVLPPGALRVAGLYAPSNAWAFARGLLSDGTTAVLNLDLTASSVSARGSLSVTGAIAVTTVSAGVPYAVVATSAAGLLSGVPEVSLCQLGSRDPFLRPALRAELLAYESVPTTNAVPRAPGGSGSCAALAASTAAATAVVISAPIAADGSFAFVPGIAPGHYLLRVPGDLDDDSRNGDEAVEYSQLVAVGPSGVVLQARLGRGSKVSGAVFGPPGLPSGRQFRVALLGVDGAEIRAAIVALAADGSAAFTFDGVGDGAYSIIAEDLASPRAWVVPTQSVTVAGADVAGLRLAVAPAGIIRARLAIARLQADGAQVATLITRDNAGLLPSGFKASVAFGSRKFSANIGTDGSIVDDLGRLVFDGLPGGLYDAAFSGPNDAASLAAGAMDLAPAKISAVSVAPGQAVDLGVVVMFSGSFVSGRVTSLTGDAVSGLRVCARSSAAGAAAPGAAGADACAETDSAGRYLIRGLDPSQRWFDVTAAPRGTVVSGQALPPYAAKRALSIDVSSGAVVDFALGPAASIITGRVTGAAGLALTSILGPADEIAPGAVVTLQAGGVSPSDDPSADLSLRTLPDGTFTIPAVAVGSYRLTASAIGQGSVVQSVVVASTSTDLGTLTLGAGASLTGAVRMPDGTSAPSSEVTAIAATTPDSSEFVYAALRPDPSGAAVAGYSFGGLNVGKIYRILVIDSAGSTTIPPEAAAVALTSTSTPRVLDLTLRPAAGPVTIRGWRSGSLWTIAARFPRPIRSRYSADSDATLFLTTASATGALSGAALSADRFSVAAVYAPGPGESAAVFSASAPLSSVDWNSASPSSRELIASATTAVQVSGDGFTRATLLNGLGGALTLDGDAGRVVMPRGTFGVDAASAVAVTLTRAASAAVYAAAAPAVVPAGPYYDVTLGGAGPATLSRSAQLTLSYSTSVADPSRLRVYWWNPAAGAYILTPDAAGNPLTIDRAARTVTLSVKHFSTYVLLDSGLASIGGSDFGGGQLDAYNFPNPFDLSVKTVTTIHGGGAPAIRGTMIRVSVPPGQSGPGSLRVYDVTGRLVRTIDMGSLSGGRVYYQVWDGRNDGGADVASGLYLGLIDVGGKRKTFKMAVLK